MNRTLAIGSGSVFLIGVATLAFIGTSGGEPSAARNVSTREAPRGPLESAVRRAQAQGATVASSQEARAGENMLQRTVLDRGSGAAARYDVCFGATFDNNGGTAMCRASDSKDLSSPQLSVTFTGGDRYVIAGSVPSDAVQGSISSESRRVAVEFTDGMFVTESLPRDAVGAFVYTDSAGRPHTTDLRSAAKGSGPDGP